MHNISIKCAGNDKIPKKEKNGTFYKNGVIKIESDKYSDTISLTLPEDADGNLTLKINDETYKSVELEHGKAIINLTNLVGSFDYTAYYEGRYMVDEKTGYFYNRYSEDYGINYDIFHNFTSTAYICLNLPEDATGNFTFEMDNETKTTEVINGSAKFLIPTNKIGEHPFTAYYTGNYILKSEHSSYIVKSVYTYFEEMDYKSEEYIYLDLPENAIGNLTLEINGENKTAEVIGGHAKMELPTDNIGKYDFKAYYNGNYEIEPINGTCLVYPIYKFGDSSTHHIDDDFYGLKPITLEVENKTTGKLIITTYNDYEILEMDISEPVTTISLDKYLDELVDHLMGYTIYLKSEFISENNSFILGRYSFFLKDYYALKFTKNRDITMYYQDGTTFSVQILEKYVKNIGENKKVKVKIGSKTYNLKTDKNGEIKLKITQLPGKYTITTTYEWYSTTNRLVVKQVLTMKSVTVKKSAKKLVLTATLKKGKVPIKSKQVTFKFNGKTYKAKTNKKGIAKVTVPKSVLKKLKVGKKVTYQATYLKNTVKKTVKVKK